MVHSAVRNFLRLLEALFVSFLLVAAVAAWRLSNGPVPLDFVTPYIEEALADPGSGISVSLERTILTWAGWERALDLRAVGVHAISADHGVIASVPEVSISLSGRGLLHGVLAPRTIELIGPRLRLVRDADGRMQWGLGEPEMGAQPDSTPVVGRLLSGLLRPDPDSLAGHLVRVAIIDAELSVEDHKIGLHWRAPDVDFRLQRDEGGLAAEGRLLIDVGGELAEADAQGTYRVVDGRVAGNVVFRDLRPSIFANFDPQLAPLATLDLPLAGLVEVGFDVESGLDTLSFDITGTDGVLRLPDPVGVDYPVVALAMRGGVSDGGARITLDEFSADLGGPAVEASAVAIRDAEGVSLAADAVAREMPVDALDRYWPPGLGRNARDWVVDSLSDGVVTEATVTLTARQTAAGEWLLHRLDGRILPEGVTVDYLKPMPPVRNAAAVASFDQNSFTIRVKSGELYGLRVKSGTVALKDLEKKDSIADIRLGIAGPLRDALKVIDHKPLGYTSKLGLDGGKAAGDAVVDLSLVFPLVNDVRLDDVEVRARADLANVRLPRVLLGLDLSEGRLALEVDGRGMDVSGPVVLGSIPARLSWRENFGRKAPFDSRYRLQATLDEAQRREIGLDGPPFQPPFLAGPVAVDVVATLRRGVNGEVEVAADLAGAEMDLPGFGWTKAAGVAAAASAKLVLRDEKLAAVPSFEVRGGGLSASGAVAFDAEGKARRIAFDRIAFGRTDVAGNLELRHGGGLDVDARGPSFDAAPVLGGNGAGAGDGAGPVPAQAGDGVGGEDDQDLPPMSIRLAVDRLWLGDRAAVSSARLDMHRDAEDWNALHLEALADGGKPLRLDIGPEGGDRGVRLESADAGAVLRSLDVFDNMMGGRLTVLGTWDRDGSVAGRAEIKDYQVVNAPLLARLLTVAAFSGIVDLLRGDGISFSTFEAPFTLRDGILDFSDARAFGPALGLTSKGRVDLDREIMAVEGTIVPVYAFNSVLGQVPVLGPLLTGEKGSGIFAATYTMKGPTADPEIAVNPLAALTPGVLRNLFGVFGGSGSELPSADPQTTAPDRTAPTGLDAPATGETLPK